MKILFICNRGETGGATKSLLSMVKELTKLGVECILVTPNKKGNIVNFCKSNKIEYIYIKYFEIAYAFNISLVRKIIKFILLPYYLICNLFVNSYSVWKISRIIEMNTIDLIHTNVNRDNFGILLSKKYNIPNIMHLREFGKEDFKCIYLKSNIYKYFNKNVNYFVAISNIIKKYYVSNGIENNKIITIYNGIDDTKIKVSKKNHNNDKYKIIILSGISPEKGQIQVIKAIKMMDKKTRDNIEVHLYGSGSPEYIKSLKKYIKDNNMINTFIFKGYCNDVYSMMGEYNLAVTPSKSEAFGRVTVEYMLAKIPVIVSNTGANVEIIEDKKTGFIYQYNNISDLYNKILFAYKNENIAKKVADEAYTAAKQKFVSSVNAKEILNLYRNLLIKEDNNDN